MLSKDLMLEAAEQIALAADPKYAFSCNAVLKGLMDDLSIGDFEYRHEHLNWYERELRSQTVVTNSYIPMIWHPDRAEYVGCAEAHQHRVYFLLILAESGLIEDGPYTPEDQDAKDSIR